MNIAKYSLENTKVVYFFLAILLVGGVLSFDLLGKKEDSPFVIKTAVIMVMRHCKESFFIRFFPPKHILRLCGCG